MAKRRLTMRELAERTGIPYRSLQNYLLGKHDIPAPQLGQIAEALDVTADWLILEKPANFDLDVLASTLPLVEDLRVFTKHKGEYEEIARIIANIYSRDYYIKHRPSDRQLAALERELVAE